MNQHRREYYLDNLRFCIILLVVFHHAGQAYGDGGDWPVIDSLQVPLLGIFFSINAAFFMGLLFFISGYVLPVALAKYGTRSCLFSKIKRLLVPYVIIAVCLFIPINYSFGHFNSFSQYAAFLITPAGVASFTAHLWFIVHLFIYSLGYIGYEYLRTKYQQQRDVQQMTPLGSGRFFLGAGITVILLSLVSYWVRLSFPIDRWVMFANLVRMEPAHMPQYLLFFVLGVVFRKRNMVQRIQRRDGFICITSAVMLIITAYCWYFLSSHNLSPFSRIIWENLLAVSISVGLLVMFREYITRHSNYWRFLAHNAYGVYLFHVFPMVGLQMALLEQPLSGNTKFFIVSIITACVCYVQVFLLRSIPRVKEYV